MFFSISDKFVAISETNADNHCLQLCLYDLKDCTKRPVRIDLSADNGNEEKQKNAKNSDSKDRTDYDIICGNFSKDSKYLGVCDNRKQLIVLINIENNWRQIVSTKVGRNCIKLLFAFNKNAVICGHKSGDVYEYDLDASTDQSCSGRLLLGHCSMLLDLTLTSDSKYLITSDRDEKIRISNYPNTYNIQSYGLGHKEFVSSLTTINDETIVSGSGDGSIRVWNACDGKQLDVLFCDSKPTLESEDKKGTEFPVKKLVANRRTGADFVCVSFYKQSVLNIYSIQSLSLKLIHTMSLDTEPIDISFDLCESDILWVLLQKSENPLNVFKISSENITKSDIYENVLKELNSNKSFVNNCSNSNTSNELDGLYKHWFNNVETYLQKKRQRQEVMDKKKKFTQF